MSGELEVLLPYQKAWIEDDSEQKIAEKGRRVGLSYTEALNAVLKAAPKKKPQNTYYLSYNKEMTRQFISDCAEWARKLDVAVSGIIEETIIDNDRNDILTYKIKCSSGAEICGLPSEAYTLRSKQGRVVLDEAAFCVNFDEVVKAAQALLIWGGQFSIISTHNGEESKFNVLIDSIKKGAEKEWSLHRVTFNDAVMQGLHKRICLVLGETWTQELQDAWVEKIYNIYKYNALEELGAVPNKSGTKYFTRSLLNSVRDYSIMVLRWTFSDDFLYKKSDEKTERIFADFEAAVVPLLRKCAKPLSFGMDFARSGNLTVIWAAEEISRSLMTRFVLEVKNCPFAEQEHLVRLLLGFCQKAKILTGMAIDARGNGQHLAENISLEFAGAVLGVMETPAYYAGVFPKTRALLESADLTVPDDELLLNDFAAVVLKNGIPSISATQTSTDNGKRHGDGAAACALMVHASIECASDPAPEFAGTEGKRAKMFRGF